MTRLTLALLCSCVALLAASGRDDRLITDPKSITSASNPGAAPGGEIFDLFAIPAPGGPPVNLTRTPDISETGPHWSPDGRTLAISIKPKTQPIFDVALLDWRTPEVRNLTHEQSKNRASRIAAWSPDGRTPLNRSNQKGGYSNVALLDIATRKPTWVTDTQWDAAAGDFAPKGGRFTYRINEDGRTKTYIAERGSSQSEPLNFPEGLTSPSGHPTAFSPSGDRLPISHQSSNRPARPGYGMSFQKANYKDLGGGDLRDEVQAHESPELQGENDIRDPKEEADLKEAHQ